MKSLCWFVALFVVQIAHAEEMPRLTVDSTGGFLVEIPYLEVRTPDATIACQASLVSNEGFSAFSVVPGSVGILAVSKCNDWDEIRMGEFLLSNNTWGKDEIGSYSLPYRQCIYGFGENNSFNIEWNWIWLERALRHQCGSV